MEIPKTKPFISYQNFEERSDASGTFEDIRFVNRRSWVNITIWTTAAVLAFGATSYVVHTPKTSVFTEQAVLYKADDDDLGYIDDTLSKGTCDAFTFNSKPLDSVIKGGGFIFGTTYGEESECITGLKDDNNVLLLKDFSYDASLYSKFALTYHDDPFAVGLRFAKDDRALNGSFCQGYTGYLCEMDLSYQNDSTTLMNYELIIKECTTTEELKNIARSSYYVGSDSLSISEFYTLEFTAVGSNLKCSVSDPSGLELSSLRSNNDDFEDAKGYSVLAFKGHERTYMKAVDVCALSPSIAPSVSPTMEPTLHPTMEPTMDPTRIVDEPSVSPTVSSVPTSSVPTTPQPSSGPTSSPTRDPSHKPTHKPTYSPTHKPTHDPTHKPTHDPTHKPTHDPTHKPTYDPTHKPTEYPTHKPTHDPTHKPTTSTEYPTHKPTTSVSGVFCERKEHAMVEAGNWSWGESYHVFDCLLKPNSDGKNILGYSEYNLTDGSVDVKFMFPESVQNQESMIALRSSKSKASDESSDWCGGHDRFVCVTEVNAEKKAKLVIKKCRKKEESKVVSSHFTKLDHDSWYTHSFGAVEDYLECALYDSSGAKVVEVTANATDYAGSNYLQYSDIAIGAKGDQYYYKDIMLHKSVLI